MDPNMASDAPSSTGDAPSSTENAAPNTESEPSGSKCELMSLEARYNLNGRREIKPSTGRIEPSGRRLGSEWAKYALTLTKFYSHEGREGKNHLEIRSPHLLKALKTVVQYYPGAPFITDTRVTYDKPYQLLLHYLKDLQEYSDRNNDDTVKMHMDLLISVVREEMGDVLDELEVVVPLKKITFSLAWFIFRPGTMIYTEQNGAPEQYRVSSTKYDTSCGREKLNITAEHIDFDGKDFRTRIQCLEIPEFPSAVDISSLPVCPLKFHHHEEVVLKSLAERGHKWFRIHKANPKTMTWAGIANCIPRGHGMKKFAISGRIVIDNDTFNTINPNLRPSMGDIVRDRAVPVPVNSSRSYDYDMGSDSEYEDENELTTKKPYAQTLCEENFTDENAALCTAFVRGYSLNKRLWGSFDVSLAKEVEWSTNAFERLILRTESKETIRALVKSYIDTPTSKVIPDLIQGKGLGMVFLLHGPPGVGKTLTAETIAEHLQRPLYMVSGGELGTTPDSVDERLSRVLEVATIWKAVVLIDEADVFLQERDLDNLERNSLVAIFLRQLEYYEGLMFLTTNRVSCIDDAFQSRIDVALHYPDLTETMRRQLWEASLKSLDPTTLDIDLETALPLLEKEEMNGREIRKTIKAAKLMASYYNEKLTLDRLFTLMSFRMVGSLPGLADGFGGKPSGTKRQRVE